MTFYLYGTSACHLCEQAADILDHIRHTRTLQWLEIDIADDDALLARYGLLIPVFYDANSDRSLCWPFSESDVLALLNSKS